MKRALISVTDTTGAADFAKALIGLGYEIVSTPKTAELLRKNGVSVTEISKTEAFSECMGKKTHVVAVNFPPFKDAIIQKNTMLDDAVESIDVSASSMLRAAAKNWRDVVVVIEPEDYTTVLDWLKKGYVDSDDKFNLACKVFEYTAAYDALVASFLLSRQDNSPLFPRSLTLTFERVFKMPYGENPHQRAAFYREIKTARNGVAGATLKHGGDISFNNINNSDTAIDLLKEFSVVVPCAVIVKRANPCGVGIGETLEDALCEAFEADPSSIRGASLAVNRDVDLATAMKIAEQELEVIVAPSFSDEAMEVLSQKENLSLLAHNEINKHNHYGMLDMKKIAGGLLAQELDTELYDEADIKTITKRAPTKREITQLMFAWRVAKHAKSNAVVLVKGNATVGIGTGQTRRLAALKLAIQKAGGQNAEGSVMASDSALRSAGCVKAAAKAGITAIIHPGSQTGLDEVVAACDEAGIAMVITGMRHLKY